MNIIIEATDFNVKNKYDPTKVRVYQEEQRETEVEIKSEEEMQRLRKVERFMIARRRALNNKDKDRRNFSIISEQEMIEQEKQR